MNVKLTKALGIAAVSLALCTSISKADPADWLPPGSQVDPASASPEYLSPGSRVDGNALLGKLLFNSPSLLGEAAARMGVSCNSCHPAGHQNTQFFISGLSAAPGDIDLTHSFWFEAGEDHQFNPLPIPSLQNITSTAPYGSRVVHQTLAGFTRHVIVDEFGGPHPDPVNMSALIAYMSLLKSAEDAESAPAPNIPIAAYFKLLERPFAKSDLAAQRKIAYLLREELGRRARLDADNVQYASWAKWLRDVTALAAIDPVRSEKRLKQLLGQIAD